MFELPNSIVVLCCKLIISVLHRPNITVKIPYILETIYNYKWLGNTWSPLLCKERQAKE